MARYQLADGNVIVADKDFIDAYYPGATLLPEPPQPMATVTLTKLEYMDRFTDIELAGIYAAAKTSVQVEIWLERFKLATEVDLSDPRTVAGVQALETAGLIAPGRTAEILGL